MAKIFGLKLVHPAAFCKKRVRKVTSSDRARMRRWSKQTRYAPLYAPLHAEWIRLKPNIMAILALNEKIPGSVVDIGCLNIYTKYLLKIPRHLPKIHV